MQFKVPQFLEIEDKIFGPFTFRQFIYLIGGAGVCFVLYRLLGFWWGVLPIILLAAFSLALSFYKPNNKPFIFMVEAAFHYTLQSKLYIWKKPENRERNKKEEGRAADKADKAQQDFYAAMGGGKLSGSKLRDLAWSLDVLDLNKQSSNTGGEPIMRK
ncbi:MAG: PrgI family protein [Patescibacteria group bacterium]